jgi:uncharacterized protein (TIGR00369 family)
MELFMTQGDDLIATSKNVVLHGGMVRTLGIRFLSLTVDKVEGEMPITDAHLNVSGGVNGGALMAFADIIAAAGAVEAREPGWHGGTLESKTNFLAVAKAPLIRGVAEVLHRGRTTSVWQTTLTNDDGRRVAIVIQTQMNLPPKSKE